MSMAQWQQLLLEPDRLEGDSAHSAWFDAIARRLLCGCRVMVRNQPHRFTEVEIYYHGGTHLDPFAHCDPIQKGTGLWYFHRTNGVYRGGSFKGVDVTFGGPGAFGGVLIRGIEAEEGALLVDGPSLTVDRLLARTGASTVAELDEAIALRPMWDASSLLRLEWLPEMKERTVLKAPRIGLSLKRLRKSEAPPRFIMRHYRYLSEPRRIAKGKLHMVLGLHAEGRTPAEIRDLTGCTKGAIERYIADREAGTKESDFTPFFGIDLGPKELCRLHGLCSVKWGRT
jgi:hypothetical protein